MATTTTNLKLVKPDLTDFADIRVLNQNMDTLDEKVQQALDKEPDLSAYMPTTGGNFTGDITIKNNQVVSIVDKIVSDNQTSIKYSDGTIVQYATVDSPTQTNVILTLTFQTPFMDTNYYVLTTPRGDKYIPNGTSVNDANDTNTYVLDTQKTTTYCKIACDDYATGINVLVMGRWK